MTDAKRREPDERLADWVDGRMSERDRERFVAELRVNPQLQRDLEHYERTVGTVRAALRAPTAPSPMAARVLAAIAAQQVGQQGGQREAPVRAAGWTWRTAAWSLASAAALLACALWIDGWSRPAPLTTPVAKVEDGRVVDLAEVAAQPPAADPDVTTDPSSPAPEATATQSALAAKKPDARAETGAKEAKDREAKVAVEQQRAPSPEPVRGEAKPTGGVNAEGSDEREQERAQFQRAVPGRPAGPGATTRGGSGGGGGGSVPVTPAGPATGGPGGRGDEKGPPPPAAKPTEPVAPTTTAEDLARIGAQLRLADEPRSELARDGKSGEAGAPAAAPAAPAPAKAEPTIAFVLLEGDVAAPSLEKRGTLRGAAKGAEQPEGATKDPKPGDQAASRGRHGARESVEERRLGAAPAQLDAAGLRQQVDQFLAVAADTTAEPAALRWVTKSGTVDVSPWLGEVRELGDRADAARRDVAETETAKTAKEAEGQKKENADKEKDKDDDRYRKNVKQAPPVERTWLVEGPKQDVQEVLARLRVFADANRLTMRPGEIPAPRDALRDAEAATDDERKAAGSADPGALAYGATRRAGERMRVVLHLRLHPR